MREGEWKTAKIAKCEAKPVAISSRQEDKKNDAASRGSDDAISRISWPRVPCSS